MGVDRVGGVGATLDEFGSCHEGDAGNVRHARTTIDPDFANFRFLLDDVRGDYISSNRFYGDPCRRRNDPAITGNTMRA